MRTPREVTPQTIAVATNALMRRSRNRKTSSVIEMWNHHWRGWDEAAVIFTFPLEGEFDYLVRCTAHGTYTLELRSERAQEAYRSPWAWCGKCREQLGRVQHHQEVEPEPTHLHVHDILLDQAQPDGLAV